MNSVNYISYVRQEYPTKENTMNPNHITMQWVQKAAQELDHAYTHLSMEEKQEPMTNTEKNVLREELLKSQYTLPKVQSYLAKCIHRTRFTMGRIVIDVMCNKISKGLHEQVIRSLYRANATIACFGGIDSASGIRVVLLPIHAPRQKPNAVQDTIEPEHVNGGYTYVHGNTVYIYRLEEWPKVMLHELIHHIPKIQNIRWTPKMLADMYHIFEIDNAGCPVHCSTLLEPTEAVVEAWAIFLHTAYMSHEMNKDFYKLLRDEIHWNDAHIAWIMHKKARMHMVEGWKEGTHVFSYIVLRGILLQHLDEFLRMSMPYRPKDLQKLWEKGWAFIPSRIKQIKVVKKGTLRMSRYGNV